MLDYDSFKKIVEESIMDYIPDRDNYQVNIHPGLSQVKVGNKFILFNIHFFTLNF